MRILLAWVDMVGVAWPPMCSGCRVSLGQCINPDMVHMPMARLGGGVSGPTAAVPADEVFDLGR